MYKKLIIAALAVTVLFSGRVIAQDDYVMFLSESLNPLPGHATELVKGVKAHNEKFHASGDDKAYVFSILTGPRSGQFVWVQGPVKYAKLDETLSDEHTTDWDANVAAHCQAVGEIQVLKRNEELTYNPENEVVGENVLARIFYGVSDDLSL